jgi:hypothetical protein
MVARKNPVDLQASTDEIVVLKRELAEQRLEQTQRMRFFAVSPHISPYQCAIGG